MSLPKVPPTVRPPMLRPTFAPRRCWATPMRPEFSGTSPPRSAIGRLSAGEYSRPSQARAGQESAGEAGHRARHRDGR